MDSGEFPPLPPHCPPLGDVHGGMLAGFTLLPDEDEPIFVAAREGGGGGGWGCTEVPLPAPMASREAAPQPTAETSNLRARVPAGGVPGHLWSWASAASVSVPIGTTATGAPTQLLNWTTAGLVLPSPAAPQRLWLMPPAGPAVASELPPLPLDGPVVGLAPAPGPWLAVRGSARALLLGPLPHARPLPALALGAGCTAVLGAGEESAPVLVAAGGRGELLWCEPETASARLLLPTGGAVVRALERADHPRLLWAARGTQLLSLDARAPRVAALKLWEGAGGVQTLCSVGVRQLAVARGAELALLDSRYARVPLLQWALPPGAAPVLLLAALTDQLASTSAGGGLLLHGFRAGPGGLHQALMPPAAIIPRGTPLRGLVAAPNATPRPAFFALGSFGLWRAQALADRPPPPRGSLLLTTDDGVSPVRPFRRTDLRPLLQRVLPLEPEAQSTQQLQTSASLRWLAAGARKRNRASETAELWGAPPAASVGQRAAAPPLLPDESPAVAAQAASRAAWSRAAEAFDARGATS